MAKVLFSNTKDRNMFYKMKIEVLDPFFFIDTGSEQYVFLDHREFGVFKEKNRTSRIKLMLLDPFLKEAESVPGKARLHHKLALLLFQRYGLLGKPIEVSASFPLDMADFLRENGAILIPTASLYPERTQKTTEELAAIQESVRKTELAFGLIEEILKDSVIRKGEIIHRESVLTSELLKEKIEQLLLKEGMVNEEGLIISSGRQAAIPHHPGEGIIRPHEPIVCDIFPKNRATGYFADSTRTFTKGEPAKEVQKMYDAVLRSQAEGMRTVRAGVKASEVHNACAKVFLDMGFDVGDKGFVHGTGHGVGLEVHEEPRINAQSEAVLVPGNVITIEPGLYYLELGGIRIEDMVLVKENGCEVLNSYPKNFIIP